MNSRKEDTHWERDVALVRARSGSSLRRSPVILALIEETQGFNWVVTFGLLTCSLFHILTFWCLRMSCET